MLRMKRFLLLLLPLLVMPFISHGVCYANAAEPPAIIIIVANAPDDLEISLGVNGSPAQRTDKTIESYYSFYGYNLKPVDYILKVTTSDETFELLLDSPPEKHNNIYTLDLKNRTLVPGKSPFRSITLVLLRIILTLIIEAAVFYLFGYRKMRSWIVFLVANLLTQGGLNIWLGSVFTPVNSYIFLGLIIGEIIVFFIELAVFLFFIKEHRRWRTTVYVLVANILSLVVGGYLITVLPV